MELDKESLVKQIVKLSENLPDNLIQDVEIRTLSLTKKDFVSLQSKYKIKSNKFRDMEYIELHISDKVKIIQHF